MAIAKRRKATTARKTGAAKKRKTKAKVGSPATISLFGRRYKKSACALTKADATAKANAHRAKGAGKGAVVKKNHAGAGFCLYKRG